MDPGPLRNVLTHLSPGHLPPFSPQVLDVPASCFIPLSLGFIPTALRGLNLGGLVECLSPRWLLTEGKILGSSLLPLTQLQVFKKIILLKM